MDKITIQDLELRTRVGVTVRERARRQRLLVTVELHRSLAKAGRTDEMAATARYDLAAELIRKEAHRKPRRLIESVAEDVAQTLLSRRLARQVMVEVKKFSIADARWVSVQIRRSL